MEKEEKELCPICGRELINVYFNDDRRYEVDMKRCMVCNEIYGYKHKKMED